MKTYIFAALCISFAVYLVAGQADKQEQYGGGYDSGSFGSDYGSADLYPNYHGGAEVRSDGASQ